MAEAEKTVVWAIILHWRLWQMTLDCARSLLASTWPNLHILIVDNGSQDGSLERLRSQLPASVHTLPLPENRYFAGGINAGLRVALEKGGDWFFVMNNDTRVAPDMIAQLVLAAQRYVGTGIVAPLIYEAHAPDHIWNAGARKRRWWPFPQELARHAGGFQEPYPVDYVTGCGMMIARPVLEQVGFFDERYQMYYEDVDFCERVRQVGYHILVAPNARMWHLVGQSAAEEPVAMRYQRTRNRWRFYMSHRKGLERVMAAILLLMQGLFLGAKHYLAGKRTLGKAHWQGIWDGLCGVK